jgi:hypothetical protein
MIQDKYGRFGDGIRSEKGGLVPPVCHQPKPPPHSHHIAPMGQQAYLSKSCLKEKNKENP